MQQQTVGYDGSRKQKLLRSFDKTSTLIRDELICRYGKTLATTLQHDARWEYDQLIPHIPLMKGLRARVFNSWLLITAQELAAYKALAKHGKSPSEAWELCHYALRLRLGMMPSWQRWFIKRLMFSSLMRSVIARRARRQEAESNGDFKISYLVGDGRDFDFGINYLQCGNHQLVMKHGGEAFAPYICLSDMALSDALGWGLIRTQTLADGCASCDFRFKRDAETQISSKTPEVQAMIEKIRRDEAAQGAVVGGG